MISTCTYIADNFCSEACARSLARLGKRLAPASPCTSTAERIPKWALTPLEWARLSVGKSGYASDACG